MNILFSGVLDDLRSDEEKQQDFQAEELVSSFNVDWRSKEDLNKYPIWSQGQTGSCVAFAYAKQVSIEIYNQTGVWLDYSPSFIYQRRSNRPATGMNVLNGAQIVKDQGDTLEAFMASQNFRNDNEIDSIPETSIATKYAEAIKGAINAYVFLTRDIDSIANTISKGHPVGLTIYANRHEYTDTPQVIDNLTYREAEIRHQVVAVDYFVHPELGKCLWIEDSWGVGHGQGGRRIFTEEFVSKRTHLAIYLEKFVFDFGVELENVSLRQAEYGDNNQAVKDIQDFLKGQGYFPSNQDSTGYYGNITARSVLLWQLNNLSISEGQLREWGGRYFGPSSVTQANLIINN